MKGFRRTINTLVGLGLSFMVLGTQVYAADISESAVFLSVDEETVFDADELLIIDDSQGEDDADGQLNPVDLSELEDYSAVDNSSDSIEFENEAEEIDEASKELSGIDGDTATNDGRIVFPNERRFYVNPIYEDVFSEEELIAHYEAFVEEKGRKSYRLIGKSIV